MNWQPLCEPPTGHRRNRMPDQLIAMNSLNALGRKSQVLIWQIGERSEHNQRGLFPT